jgi:2-phosphosulfolactate phosphatase
MRWHIIEGIEGCRFAKDERCTAVVVDALRASTTASMLIDAGVSEMTLVSDVDTALKLKRTRPETMLYGERGGLPPEGFDFGNSPLDAQHAAGKPVGFTTTNGTTLVRESIGANDVYMASCVNGLALTQKVLEQDNDIVLIPAARIEEPDHIGQEDWTAAASIVMLTDMEVGEGATAFRQWKHMISLDGVQKLFRTSEHGQYLASLGLEADVDFCARPNQTTALPKVIGTDEFGVQLADWNT